MEVEAEAVFRSCTVGAVATVSQLQSVATAPTSGGHN